MKIFNKIKKGFTLIELVVVIAVIAILSGVSVVAYVGITNNAKKSVAQQEAASLKTFLIAELTRDPYQSKEYTDVTFVYESVDPNDLYISYVATTAGNQYNALEELIMIAQGLDFETSAENLAQKRAEFLTKLGKSKDDMDKHAGLKAKYEALTTDKQAQFLANNGGITEAKLTEYVKNKTDYDALTGAHTDYNSDKYVVSNVAAPTVVADKFVVFFKDGEMRLLHSNGQEASVIAFRAAE